jgi:glycosyltransferase involved in cell wall biosynthesis
MRVLYLTNIPSPYRVAFFDELARHCDLIVLFDFPSADDRDKDWFPAHASYRFSHLFLHTANARRVTPALSVLTWLDPTAYDIIVVGDYTTPSGMLAAAYMRARRIPFFLNADGGFVKQATLRRRRHVDADRVPDLCESPWAAALKRFLIGGATGYLSSSRHTSAYLLHYGASEKAIRLYNFSSLHESDILTRPLEGWQKDRIKEKLGLSAKLIVSVGHFIPRKGFQYLLDAWRQIGKKQDYSLLIIGGGPLRPILEDSIRHAGIDRVELLDFVRPDAVLDYYRCAEISVFPTLYDVWGLVVNEAMACGLPVITTDATIAGLTLVRDGYNGFIVPRAEAAPLAAKLECLMQDDALRKRLALNSLAAIRRYTIEEMARQHLEAFATWVK